MPFPRDPALDALDPHAMAALRAGRSARLRPAPAIRGSSAQLVAALSREMTLEPGDLIACGTSVGVLPMRDGTRVEVAIDGIGTLGNHYRKAGDRGTSEAGAA